VSKASFAKPRCSCTSIVYWVYGIGYGALSHMVTAKLCRLVYVHMPYSMATHWLAPGASLRREPRREPFRIIIPGFQFGP
jgi:hypothetical protein